MRRYCLRASAAAGQPLVVMPAEAAPKPPGSTLQGSVFEATLQLQPPTEPGADGASAGLLPGQSPAAERPASAEAVVGCLQQLLGMLRVLAPPTRLLMRLDGVLLQVGAGMLWVLTARHAAGARHVCAAPRCLLQMLPTASCPARTCRPPTAACSRCRAAAAWTCGWMRAWGRWRAWAQVGAGPGGRLEQLLGALLGLQACKTATLSHLTIGSHAPRYYLCTPQEWRPSSCRPPATAAAMRRRRRRRRMEALPLEAAGSRCWTIRRSCRLAQAAAARRVAAPQTPRRAALAAQ